MSSERDRKRFGEKVECRHVPCINDHRMFSLCARMSKIETGLDLALRRVDCAETLTDFEHS